MKFPFTDGQLVSHEVSWKAKDKTVNFIDSSCYGYYLIFYISGVTISSQIIATAALSDEFFSLQ